MEMIVNTTSDLVKWMKSYSKGRKTMYESSESEYGEPDINFVEDTIFIHNVSMVVPDNTTSREFKVIAVRTFL